MAMLPPSNELPVEIGEVEQELRKLVKRSFLEEQLNPERQFSFQPVVLEYLRYKASDQTEAHRQAINYYDQLKAKEESWKTIDDLKEYLEIFYHLCQLGEFDFAFYTIIPFDEFLMLHSYCTKTKRPEVHACPKHPVLLLPSGPDKVWALKLRGSESINKIT